MTDIVTDGNSNSHNDDDVEVNRVGVDGDVFNSKAEREEDVEENKKTDSTVFSDSLSSQTTELIDSVISEVISEHIGGASESSNAIILGDDKNNKPDTSTNPDVTSTEVEINNVKFSGSDGHIVNNDELSAKTTPTEAERTFIKSEETKFTDTISHNIAEVNNVEQHASIDGEAFTFPTTTTTTSTNDNKNFQKSADNLGSDSKPNKLTAVEHSDEEAGRMSENEFNANKPSEPRAENNIIGTNFSTPENTYELKTDATMSDKIIKHEMQNRSSDRGVGDKFDEVERNDSSDNNVTSTVNCLVPENNTRQEKNVKKESGEAGTEAKEEKKGTKIEETSRERPILDAVNSEPSPVVTENIESKPVTHETEEAKPVGNEPEVANPVVEKNKEIAEEKQEDEWVDILGNGLLKKKVIRKGKGRESRPNNGDTVNIRYEGRLDDGTVVEKNSSFLMVVGDMDVIQGMDLGVALMEDGEVCTLHTDARYAYSIYGRPDYKPSIPQNANLTYEIEVLSVIPAVPLEELSPKERVIHGDKKRARGNDLYSRKDYAGAIDSYKRGLRYLEGSPDKDVIRMKTMCLNNVSAAQLKVKAYSMALQSLNVVLDLEPDNVKALFRKGKCLEGLGKDEDALECMKKAALLDPENKQLLKDLGHIRSKVAVIHKKEKEIYQRMFQQNQQSTEEHVDEESALWPYIVGSAMVTAIAVIGGLFWHRYKV